MRYFRVRFVSETHALEHSFLVPKALQSALAAVIHACDCSPDNKSLSAFIHETYFLFGFVQLTFRFSIIADYDNALIPTIVFHLYVLLPEYLTLDTLHDDCAIKHCDADKHYRCHGCHKQAEHDRGVPLLTMNNVVDGEDHA